MRVWQIILITALVGGLIGGAVWLNSRVQQPPEPPATDPGVSNPDPVDPDPTPDPDPVDEGEGEIKIVFDPSEYDATWSYDGREGYHDFRYPVRQVGDTATFAIFCEVGCGTIYRLVPDDEVLEAYVILPNGETHDLVVTFVEVAAGGTGDPETDAYLASVGVNLVDGEILPQSKNPVLVNAPQGSTVYLKIKDTKGHFVGALVSFTPPTVVIP
jgi:hypothetical protein